MTAPVRDRFDDIPSSRRVGAHRAEQPRVNGWVVFLCAAIATIVLTVGGVFALNVWQGHITLGSETSASPQPSQSSAAPTEGVIDTNYKVLVLNGTPDDANLTPVQERVLGAGWASANVITGPASERDFPETAVYYASEEAEAAARGLADLVGGVPVHLDPNYPFEGTPVDQLILVLGTDITTLLEPTPAG